MTDNVPELGINFVVVRADDIVDEFVPPVRLCAVPPIGSSLSLPGGSYVVVGVHVRVDADGAQLWNLLIREGEHGLLLSARVTDR